jgi:lipopolysaccharide biosynthesis glycosyltransferase
MQNNFVLMVFGENALYHRQAGFAILSLIANLDDADATSITMYTDNPAWYKWLGDRVTVIETQPELIKDWRGPHDHFYRIKIKVMQDVATRMPGNVIFVDCDVVCSGNLSSFFSMLEKGAFFMDEMSYKLGEKGGRSKKLLRKANGNTYGKFTVTKQSPMWNAGIIAVPEALCQERLADALESMDAMCAGGLIRDNLEQFALGLSLDREAKLQSSENWFIHYWGWGSKTPWNALISAVFSEIYLRGFSVDDACALFRDIDITKVKPIKQTKLEKTYNSICKRLGFRKWFNTREHQALHMTNEILLNMDGHWIPQNRYDQ